MPFLSFQTARRYARSQTLAAAGLAGALAAAQLMAITAGWLTSATLRLDQSATSLDILISLSPLSLLALGVLTAIVPRQKLAWGLAAVNLVALIGAAALPRSTGALQAAVQSLPVLLTFALVLLANLGVSTALIWQLGQRPPHGHTSQFTGQIDPRVLLKRAAALTASMAVSGVLTSEYLSRSLQGAQEHAAWTLLLTAATTGLMSSAGLVWMSWRRQNEKSPNTEAPNTEAPSTEAPSTDTQDEAPYIPPLWLTPRLLLIAFALTSLGWWLIGSGITALLRSSGAHSVGIGRWSLAQLTALAAPLLGATFVWLLRYKPGRQGERALIDSLLLLGLLGWAVAHIDPVIKPHEAWASTDWINVLGALCLYAARLATVACGLTAAWYLAGTVGSREDRPLAAVVRRPALAGLLVGAALAGESAAAIMNVISPNFTPEIPLAAIGGALCIGAGLLIRRAVT